MANDAIKLLLLVIILRKISDFSVKADGIFCYNCTREAKNWKCNENDPIRCKDGEVCTTITDSSMWKGCMDGCPRSRGDDSSSVPCDECDTDLCNGPIQESDGVQHIAEMPNGTKFTLHVKTLTFWEARLNCAKDGGILATIHSSNIQGLLDDNFVTGTHVEATMEEIPPSATKVSLMDPKGVWLGLYRPGSGESNESMPWMWTDDGSVLLLPNNHSGGGQSSSSYENWFETQSSGRSPACGYMSRDSGGAWKSGSCGKLLPGYLCQYPKSTVLQSVVRNGKVYTYKGTYNGSVDCAADGEIKTTKTEIIESFSYLTEYQTEFGCSRDPPDGTLKKEGKSPSECGSFASFVICERALIPESDIRKRNEEITHPTKAASTEVTASPRGYCDDYSRNVGERLLTFPRTQNRRFGYSNEKCPDGRPEAIMFCNGRPQPAFVIFVKVNCKNNLISSLKKIAKVAKSELPLVRAMQVLHEITMFNGNLTSSNVSFLADILNGIIKNVSNVSNNTLSHAVATISGIRNVVREWRNKGKNFTDLRTKLSSFPRAMEVLAQHAMMEQNKTQTTYTADGMDVEIVALDYHTISSGGKVEHASPDERSVIRILPDLSLKRSFSNLPMRALFMTYDDDDLFPSSEDNIRVESVISATVTDGITTYSVPVEFSMLLSENPNISSNVCERSECRYYNHSEQEWKRDGCHKQQDDVHQRNVVNCQCDHTTSFAVVVSQHIRASYALDLVSTVGLCICIVCLSLTAICFVATPELRRVRSAFTHTNLCVCLALAYLVFLVGVEAIHNRYGCLVSAALTHFFLLAAWGWMAVESITMYRMFVHTFDRSTTTENPKAAIIVYALSAAIVLTTLSFAALSEYKGWEDEADCEDDIWSSYIADGYCWLKGNSLYFGFLLIVGISLCFNIVLAGIIIKAITWGRTAVPCSVEEKPIIHVMRAVLVAMLLGVAWIFAVPLAVSRDAIVQEVFGWLFAITTVIQGVFVFYFFCIRRKEVRDSWTRVINKAFMACSRSQTSGPSGVAADGSRPSGSMLYLPNVGRTPSTSTTGSEMTRKTTTSCASSPRRVARVKSDNDADEVKNDDGVKTIERSVGMADFSAGEVSGH